MKLIDDGIVDSIGIFKLIEFLEQELGVALKPEDVVLENFETIEAIMQFISERTASQ